MYLDRPRCPNCSDSDVRQKLAELDAYHMRQENERLKAESDIVPSTDDCTTQLAVELIEQLKSDLGIASACVADYVAQRDEAREAAMTCYNGMIGNTDTRHKWMNQFAKKWSWLKGREVKG